jgi:NADPH2:quinone reductase
MKAIVCSRFAPPDSLSLENVEPRALQEGEVRIEVHACGINFPDILLVQGQYQVRPELPFFPGGEVAGIVSEVADDVSGIEIGQRVMATIFWGGLAELAVAPARSLVSVPDDMDFITASVFQGGHTTSYFALKQRGQLRAGETLLVLGAAGGVGLAAVQLGKALGARVIGAVSSEEKRACVMENGADECINYTQQDLREQVKALTGGRGADVIVDPVGGDLFDSACRGVSVGGRILILGFASGRIPQYPVNLALLKSCAVVGVNYMQFFSDDPQGVRENFAELMQMFADGKIKPQIDTVYHLQEATAALLHVGERRAVGKVVVKLRD